jgi:hypothetical protein
MNIVPATPESEVCLLLFLPTDLSFNAYSILRENSPSIVIYIMVISSTSIKISGIKNVFSAPVMEFHLAERERIFTAATEAKTLGVIIVML